MFKFDKQVMPLNIYIFFIFYFFSRFSYLIWLLPYDFMCFLFIFVGVGNCAYLVLSI
jgi:hypothetical protein